MPLCFSFIPAAFIFYFAFLRQVNTMWQFSRLVFRQYGLPLPIPQTVWSKKGGLILSTSKAWQSFPARAPPGWWKATFPVCTSCRMMCLLYGRQSCPAVPSVLSSCAVPSLRTSLYFPCILYLNNTVIGSLGLAAHCCVFSVMVLNNTEVSSMLHRAFVS